MFATAAALWLVVLLGEAPTATPTAPATPPATPTASEPPAADEPAPPPGTAADRALWAAGRKASEDVVISRTRAGRLQTTVRSHRLVERLTAAEKAPGADRDRYEDLREDLVERWERNYEVFSRPWPVDPTRGCGYPLLNLESAMHVPEGPEKASELSVARAEVRACLDRSALAVRAMEQANRELEGSIAKVQAALAAAERAAAADPPAPPAKAE